MTGGMGTGSVTTRAVLLLTLTATLLFGWQRLTGTVTSARGAYPLAAARFVTGTADRFSGRVCHVTEKGMPSGLLASIFFKPDVPDTGTFGVPAVRKTGPPVWLLGSGLRHHYALAALTAENLVISFDAHADLCSGEEVDCGNWLRHWLEGAPARRAMVIGVSEMLGGEVWQGRATEFLPLPLLANARAQLWPVQARRSFFREPLPARANSPAIAAAGGDARGGWLEWRSLADWQLPQGEKLAVTVDLDCLADRGFAAEWDTGELPAPRLLALLGQLAERNTITSVSICGFAERQSASGADALRTTLLAIVAATENRR